MGHPNLRRFLGRIRNSALVVWGKQDRLLPASQAPLFVDAVPHADLPLWMRPVTSSCRRRPETVAKIGDFLAG
jgi:hypothetical protein